jgi:hypothetical protein
MCPPCGRTDVNEFHIIFKFLMRYTRINDGEVIRNSAKAVGLPLHADFEKRV